MKRMRREARPDNMKIVITSTEGSLRVKRLIADRSGSKSEAFAGKIPAHTYHIHYLLEILF